jgi:hypothetical protein
LQLEQLGQMGDLGGAAIVEDDLEHGALTISRTCEGRQRTLSGKGK